ncbi:MAG: alpha/beta hydrolase [Lutibacter sp.]|nr:MAG: alpha/beta hydrolase [Lutibacter sp.]
MPLLTSDYKPSYLFKSTHFNTVFRTFFMHATNNYNRERLELKDGDFIDLDFSTVNSDTIVIALHGLEGSSNSKYILAISRYINQQKIDVVAINHRGCSGEPNRLMESYHSGKTDDLDSVIKYIDQNNAYKNIILLGYSLGGNMTLKYIGEQGKNINRKIKCGIAISVPCDLTGSSVALARSENKIYMKKFLKSLKPKTLYKLKQFPNSFLKKDTILAAQNFYDYDNLYTAPAHGYKDAEDYWKKCSSKPFLSEIKIPTLLINALDDTFLSEECFPTEIAENSKFFFLEMPKFGGHVGFNSRMVSKNGFWVEKRIYKFLKSYLK